MGACVTEQIGGQLEPADQIELGHFFAQAVDAWATSIGAQLQDHCPGHAIAFISLGCCTLLVSGPQQRLEPRTARLGQAIKNAGAEALVVGVDCSADDALDAVGRRRLDFESSAAFPERHDELIGLPALRDRMIPEPICQRLRVSDDRLAEAKQGTDFGTMALGRAIRQRQRCVGCRVDPQLLADIGDDLRIDL
jgi:hypothetical protein